MARQASVLVCDDLLVSMLGKFTTIGIYTADITIPSEPIVANQLVFLFIVETDVDDLFERMTLEVTMPGQPSVKMDVPLAPPPPIPGRTRWFLRWPFMIQQPVLRPGRIEAKVIHEKGEILTSGPWISLLQQAPPTQPS
jgi:hypothetical protein